MQGGTQLYLHSNLSLCFLHLPRCPSHWGLLSSQTPLKDLSSNNLSHYWDSEKLHAHKLQWWCVLNLMHNTSISSCLFRLFHSLWLPYYEKQRRVIPYSHLLCINVLQIFFTYYISCFSPGQKTLAIYLVFILKKTITHWLNLGWLFLYQSGATRLPTFCCSPAISQVIQV